MGGYVPTCDLGEAAAERRPVSGDLTVSVFRQGTGYTVKPPLMHAFCRSMALLSGHSRFHTNTTLLN